MHCTSHLRHWQWTCLWSDVKFWTLLKHVALWHLHWFYNLNIVILYVNVDWKMWDTSSHLVLWCERCISHLIHCNCSCSWFDINFGKMTQTYMFWHLHLPSWCKHCVIVCIHLSWKWGHICTNGFAMYGLLSIIETFRFDMFVYEWILRQCNSNILCFDISNSWC